MKREILVVDAYNIINAWPMLKEIVEEDLDASRQKLLEMLSNYQGYTKQRVLVVFDAHMVKQGKAIKTQHHNLEVIYTKEKETADHYIEKFTQQYGRNYRIRVATSDALQQYIVLGQGATRISARELLIEVNEVQKEIQNQIAKKDLVVKRNSLGDHLNEEQRKWFEKLRRQE